ncbi:MAG: tetratricopeptide repeat protein [Rhodothermales bacterium]|nr:tetratricopeptide repeat protein [Rhodothermales bacterium]
MRFAFHGMHLIAILLVGLLAMPGRLASAQVSEAIMAFDSGNQLYRDGQYTEAITAYTRALDLGYTSGVLYFNIGNAYFRLDELGQAIRYYEKSRLLMPESHELLHSLGIARARTVDQFSRVPRPIWVVYWDSFVARTAGRWLFWPGMIVYALVLGLLAFRVRRGSRNPWLRRLLAVSALGALVLLGAAFAASIQAERRHMAVVLAPQSALRDAPTPNAAVALTVHEGLLVEILGNAEPWVEVRLPNGARGWVDAGDLADV